MATWSLIPAEAGGKLASGRSPRCLSGHDQRCLERLYYFVYVYLDDILIYSPDLETHKKHIATVLERLLEHKLYVEAEKSEFHTDTSPSWAS